jgi:Uncharacterized protein conserved in bacteria (DUF2188)
MSGVDPLPRIIVEAWPSGGWAVRIDGHPVPVSRHDTEDEALDRAAAYRQGFANEQLRRVRDGPGGSARPTNT